LWKPLKFLPGKAEGPGECGSGVFIAEGVDGVGDMRLGDSTVVVAETLLEVFLLNVGLLSSAAEVSGLRVPA